MALICPSNLFYFDFEREINKQTSFTILAEIRLLSCVKLSALEFTNFTFVIINPYIWHNLPLSLSSDKWIMTPKDAQWQQYPVPAQNHLLECVRLSPRHQVLGWHDKSGARLEWVQMDAIWASPAGNPASFQQQTCLGQKCTHLPQPACKVTDLRYS